MHNHLSSKFMLRTFGSRGVIAPKFVSALVKELSARTGSRRSNVSSGTEKAIVKHPLTRRLVADGIAVDGAVLREAVKSYLSVVANAAVRRVWNRQTEMSAVRTGQSGELRENIAAVDSAFVDVSLPDDPIESDVFNRLYMDLMPQRLRHDYGEYYTPDWLADHVIEMAGYDGDPAVKLLDPACGSGTFLMRAIALLRRRCKSMKLSPAKTLKLLSNNIVGLDLDPAAVNAAIANFLLAVADLLPRFRGKLHVPVYCADSILDESESNLPGKMTNSFDIIVGNPPWINWESIDAEYRDKTMPLWKRHGLFPHSGMDAILGKSKKDLSMLMTYQAMERFLTPKGILAFVITRATLKSAGSGQGFRRFMLGDNTPIRPVKVDDLSEIKPFGSTGGSALIIVLKKGKPPAYPVTYSLWKRKKGGKRPTSWSSLDEAKSKSRLIPLLAQPVDPDDSTSAWITADSEALDVLRKILGPSSYTAYAGVYSGGANGVYWLRIIESLPEGSLLVENIPSAGKRTVKATRALLEPDLIYPLLRSGEVNRWRARGAIAVLMVQDPDSRRGIDEDVFKKKYPKTYKYLKSFEEILRTRAAWRRFFTTRKGETYVERAPFYSMFAVGKYTFAPYKVVWPRMASSLEAVVVGPIGSTPVFPQETLTFIPLDDPVEAHYICALLNSTPVGFAARAYSQVGGKGFASPHLLRYLRIPRFDPSKKNHQSAASLSARAHELAGNGEEIPSILQEELNRTSARILGLTVKDLRIIEKSRSRLEN